MVLDLFSNPGETVNPAIKPTPELYLTVACLRRRAANMVAEILNNEGNEANGNARAKNLAAVLREKFEQIFGPECLQRASQTFVEWNRLIDIGRASKADGILAFKNPVGKGKINEKMTKVRVTEALRVQILIVEVLKEIDKHFGMNTPNKVNELSSKATPKAKASPVSPPPPPQDESYGIDLSRGLEPLTKEQIKELEKMDTIAPTSQLKGFADNVDWYSVLLNVPSDTLERVLEEAMEESKEETNTSKRKLDKGPSEEPSDAQFKKKRTGIADIYIQDINEGNKPRK